MVSESLMKSLDTEILLCYTETLFMGFICKSKPESSSFLSSAFPLCSSFQAFKNITQSPFQAIHIKHTAIWGKGFLLVHLVLECFNGDHFKWVNPKPGTNLHAVERECTVPRPTQLSVSPLIVTHSSLLRAVEICSSFVFLRRSSFPWILSRIKPTHFLDLQCPLES